MQKTRIISIVGPESTGKTTLAHDLGTHFNAPVVNEFARNYLEERNGAYDEADLYDIAKRQLGLEEAALDKSPDLLICDTDIVVIKIWQEFKYGRPNPFMDYLLSKQQPRTHLLTYPDLPWEKDPLRENPNDLIKLFNMYEDVLRSMKADYFVVKGFQSKRLENALSAINGHSERSMRSEEPNVESS